MNGYVAAAVAVLIWASYPVATRAAVTGAFSPQELVALRFGVGALLFAPYLALRWRHVARVSWLRGVPLTVFQGAGMGALVIFGLQLAPANHQAALGPGFSPAWVALLGFLVFSRQPSMRALAGAALCVGGALMMAWSSIWDRGPMVLLGDAMFLAASGLGALYVLQLRRWEIGPLEGAAIVSLYSAAVVVPYCLFSLPAGAAEAGAHELLWQILWQGVLIGCVAFIALNQAIARLGAERSAALVAFVPVLTALLAFFFLGEAPSTMELAALLAISAGVSIAAAADAPPRPAGRPLAAPPQSPPPAGCPVRDNAP